MSLFGSAAGQLRSIFQHLGKQDSYPTEAWMRQEAKYNQQRYYFEGDVFAELADPEDPEGPLKYPLQVNLVRTAAEIESSYLWGQWEDSLARFSVSALKHGHEQPSEHAEEVAKKIQEALGEAWQFNEANSVLAQSSLDSSADGGAYCKVIWDPLRKRPRIEFILAPYCFPRWHPLNLDVLIECIIAFPIRQEDARQLYGVEIRNNEGLYWEKWTLQSFSRMIDSIVLNQGPNLYGFMPIEYIPRQRLGGHFYGVSITEGLMGLQDEVNARLADTGEGINYSSHPIRWVRDYHGDMDVLEVGPDALWDLGSSQLGQKTGPEAGVLEAGGEYTSAIEFVNVLLQLGQDAAHVPPVALGRDEGSQRSGLTLLLRMLPLTQSVKRQRINWNSGLKRINQKILTLMARFGERAFTERDVIQHEITTLFGPILPKDRAELINENLSLVGGGLRHPKTALKELGCKDPEAEWKEIEAYQQALVASGVARQQIMVRKEG